MSSDFHIAKQRVISAHKICTGALTHSMKRALEALERAETAMPKDGGVIFNEKPVEPNAVILKGKVFEFKNAYDANAFYDLHVSGRGSYKTQLIHIIKEG